MKKLLMFLFVGAMGSLSFATETSIKVEEESVITPPPFFQFLQDNETALDEGFAENGECKECAENAAAEVAACPAPEGK